MSMSCLLEIDFQFENSFPQSKVMDLKRFLGNRDIQWIITGEPPGGYKIATGILIGNLWESDNSRR